MELAVLHGEFLILIKVFEFCLLQMVGCMPWLMINVGTGLGHQYFR